MEFSPSWAHGRVPEIERPLLGGPHNLILSIHFEHPYSLDL